MGLANLGKAFMKVTIWSWKWTWECRKKMGVGYKTGTYAGRHALLCTMNEDIARLLKSINLYDYAPLHENECSVS